MQNLKLRREECQLPQRLEIGASYTFAGSRGILIEIDGSHMGMLHDTERVGIDLFGPKEREFSLFFDTASLHLPGTVKEARIRYLQDDRWELLIETEDGRYGYSENL